MDFKDQIIQEYLKTGCGYRKLQEKYLIGRATICRWVQEYQRIHHLPRIPLQQKHYISPMSKKRVADPDRERELREKISLLEKQLKHQQLKAEVLDTMINVAEKELNISIRKKPGTQQSAK
jgi:transposase-like protein